MDNEFLRREKQEQENKNAENIVIVLGLVKSLLTAFADLKKEVRAVREDLRNTGKLRPLRSSAGDSSVQGGAVNSADQPQGSTAGTPASSEDQAIKASTSGTAKEGEA